MYQFNNLASTPDVQTFNGGNNNLIIGGYVFRGLSATLPSANGDLYETSTTNAKYYKVDINGVTGPTPIVGYLFIYSDGLTIGWISARITAVVDAGTYWDITLDTVFAGALTTGDPYNLAIQPATDSWQTWTKPNNAMLIHILCIGAGGGGGGGRRNSAATTTTGGGGGGSGAVTSMYVPAFLIPDTLYIQVGIGGKGAGILTSDFVNRSLAGTTGGTSYVALYPSYTGTSQVGNLLLSATGGGRGSGVSAAGTAGAAITVGASSPFYLGLGQFTSSIGCPGTAGVTGGVSVLIIGQFNSGITCGGGAGGGFNVTPSNGGIINTPSSLIPYLTILEGGFANGTLTNISGKNGYAVKKPLMYVGGSGGGGATTTNGGNGGNGAIGSGGGGGGCCVGAFSSGAGGDGGNGIVIITSYSI
jgi:hypothetical protein